MTTPRNLGKINRNKGLKAQSHMNSRSLSAEQPFQSRRMINFAAYF